MGPSVENLGFCRIELGLGLRLERMGRRVECGCFM